MISSILHFNPSLQLNKKQNLEMTTKESWGTSTEGGGGECWHRGASAQTGAKLELEKFTDGAQGTTKQQSQPDICFCPLALGSGAGTGYSVRFYDSAPRLSRQDSNCQLIHLTTCLVLSCIRETFLKELWPWLGPGAQQATADVPQEGHR